MVAGPLGNYSSAVRHEGWIVVASRNFDLRLEERDVQFPVLLALVSVFERARTV